MAIYPKYSPALYCTLTGKSKALQIYRWLQAFSSNSLQLLGCNSLLVITSSTTLHALFSLAFVD
jgi:hypothetical protein